MSSMRILALLALVLALPAIAQVPVSPIGLSGFKGEPWGMADTVLAGALGPPHQVRSGAGGLVALTYPARFGAAQGLSVFTFYPGQGLQAGFDLIPLASPGDCPRVVSGVIAGIARAYPELVGLPLPEEADRSVSGVCVPDPAAAPLAWRDSLGNRVTVGRHPDMPALVVLYQSAVGEGFRPPAGQPPRSVVMARFMSPGAGGGAALPPSLWP